MYVCLTAIVTADVCYLGVCVWALLLYNEERRVKCRIAFPCALETSRLKRQQCLCVKVIDILSVFSPSVPPAPVFSSSRLPALLICASFSRVSKSVSPFFVS